ncbi:hypothetical protein TRL7639_03709 [Falsiruegeria litorea R37]|uniref:Lipoprotein n=1 Tax=Falsiruegeria litorea R37 TaxID=1200284 RepID=A0A1Y5TJM8_9RHOB|nr:hypothetical protein [Falsiruegeria litorea]SLN65672.1 hypothetical protein TRL7639_03709 [Falsiruegeria litorea R37]
MFRLLLVGALALGLAGCASTRGPQATDTQIAAVSYRDAGPATLTLYTMINNRTGSGGHTSLMINARERIIFDPAGSFRADIVPERNDVLYGITPAVEQAYRASHARSTHHVVVQEIEVTPEQAEVAYQLARQMGPVPGAFCASATSQLLQQVPGFEGIKSGFQPTSLSAQFEQMPGVKTERYYENDDADLQKGLAENNARLNAQAAAGG